MHVHQICQRPGGQSIYRLQTHIQSRKSLWASQSLFLGERCERQHSVGLIVSSPRFRLAFVMRIDPNFCSCAQAATPLRLKALAAFMEQHSTADDHTQLLAIISFLLTQIKVRIATSGPRACFGVSSLLSCACQG